MELIDDEEIKANVIFEMVDITMKMNPTIRTIEENDEEEQEEEEEVPVHSTVKEYYEKMYNL